MLLSRAGISLMIWLIVFTILITVIIAFRFWAVRIKKRSLRPDDYMVVVAWLNTVALACVTWWAIANGLGAHTSELNEYELGVQFKLIVASGVTWLLGTVFCKLSILWLYTCIFTTKNFKYAAWFLMAIVAGYGISFLPVFLTNCHPISFAWHPVPGGYCKSLAIEELWSVSINMVIDTAIVILPMSPLWRLQMAARNKIAISFMFGLGFVTVGIMAWRIQITNNANSQKDFVYGLGLIGLVSFLELWLGIIIVCLPTLAPLFAKYIRPVISKITGASKRSGGPGRLREAQNTIGGGSSGRRKNYGKLDKDSYLELEEGRHFSTAKAMGVSASSAEEDETWMNEPNAIGVRHEIHVDDERQR